MKIQQENIWEYPKIRENFLSRTIPVIRYDRNTKGIFYPRYF